MKILFKTSAVVAAVLIAFFSLIQLPSPAKAAPLMFAVHFIAYGTLIGLVYLSLKHKNFKSIGTAAVLVFVYSVAIELAQSQVGRVPSLADVLFNGSGVLLGTAFMETFR